MNSWFIRYAPGANNWALREDSGAYVIAPSVAAVTAAGQSLTMPSGRTLTPATAQVGVTASAVTLLGSNTARPAGGVLVVAGFAPSVGQSHVRAPTTGAVALAGYAPAVGISHVVAPAVGAVNATGGTPALLFDFKAHPTTGSATITGKTPGVLRSSPVITPVTGALGISSDYHEAVLGSRTTVTFPFLASAQGFVATPGAGTTMAWTGTTGNPLGSLRTITTGANRNAVNVWTLTTDWPSLGIPGNHVITGIIAKRAQSRVTSFAAGYPTVSTVSAVTLTPTGHPAITLAAGRTILAEDSNWTTQTSADTTGLEIGSGGSLTITLGSNLRTLNEVLATVTLLQDNLSFVVLYTESRVLKPVAITVSLAGFRPTLRYGSVISVESWFPRLTDGFNTWGARFGAGSGSSFAPAAAGVAIASDAPTLLRGSPTITVAACSLGVEGYAPTVLGNPIHVIGADYWDSEPATLSGVSVRVVTQINPTLHPAAGAALAITGYAPTLVVRNIIVPPVAGAVITGYAPTVARDYTLTQLVGAATLTGYAPALDFGSPTFRPATAQLTVTTVAPTFPERPVLRPETAQLVVSWARPEILNGPRVEQAVGAATLTGYAPTLAYGVGFNVPSGQLTLTAAAVYVDTFRVHRVTAALTAQPATVAGSGYVRKRFTAALQAESPLLFAGSGKRRIVGSGDWQAGPASFQGTVSTVEDALQAEPATLYARVRQIGFHAEHRRMKPERVNRYTVALKPSPRFRVRPPNKRKPTR